MRDKRPLIIFGVAFVLLLLVFLLIKGSGPRFNWEESYKETSKSPYGTHVTYSLLQDYFPDYSLNTINKSIEDELPVKEGETNANYFFIGEGLYMDTSDVDRLLAFVEKGNTAFISSKTVPYDLMFYVYYQECNDYFWDDYSYTSDTIGELNMLHDSLKASADLEFKYIRKGKTQSYQWHYIDSIYFCEEDYSFIRLGTLKNDLVNFAKIKYGEGYFFFHTNPIAFSNIQLLDEVGLTYANKVFSHLQEGPIYWDTYSRVKEAVSRRRNQMQNYSPERELSSEGPLTYILDQSSLSWAWYILLATAFLYLFFRAKRNQRIIPVYEGNKNTSLEFISTIGSLYFLQNDHKKLSIQKMKLFLAHVRDRYNISVKDEINEKFVKRLSLKSEVPESVINKIIQFYENIKGSSFVSDQSLIDFHQALEKFYNNRK